MAARDDRLTVLYDGGCGFCKWLLALLLRWDRGARLRPVRLESDNAARLLGDLDEEERLASWHLVEPDGTRASGGDAIPRVLRALPGGGIAAAPFARFPRTTARGYEWVARNRTALSRWVPRGSKRRAAERVRRREVAGD